MRDVTKTWLQGVGLLFIRLVLIPLPLMVRGSVPVAQDGPLIVLRSPWTDAEPAIITAGGYIVSPETSTFGVFAASEDPDFKNRLSALGYWTIQPGPLARLICGVPE